MKHHNSEHKTGLDELAIQLPGSVGSINNRFTCRLHAYIVHTKDIDQFLNEISRVTDLADEVPIAWIRNTLEIIRLQVKECIDTLPRGQYVWSQKWATESHVNIIIKLVNHITQMLSDICQLIYANGYYFVWENNQRVTRKNQDLSIYLNRSTGL